MPFPSARVVAEEAGIELGKGLLARGQGGALATTAPATRPAAAGVKAGLESPWEIRSTGTRDPCEGRAMQPVSEEQLRVALEAIAASHPGADVLTAGVAEHYAVGSADALELYLNANRREALFEGDEYVTWVVTLFRGHATKVSFFRSRACSTGSDTLPP